jgi:hypothetical protein
VPKPPLIRSEDKQLRPVKPTVPSRRIGPSPTSSAQPPASFSLFALDGDALDEDDLHALDEDDHHALDEDDLQNFLKEIAGLDAAGSGPEIDFTETGTPPHASKSTRSKKRKSENQVVSGLDTEGIPSSKRSKRDMPAKEAAPEPHMIPSAYKSTSKGPTR